MSKISETSEFVYSADLSGHIIQLMDDNDCKSNIQFAQLVGISDHVVALIVKHNIVPTLRPLIKIADKFDLSLTFLLGLSKENDFIASAKPVTFHERLDGLCKERSLKLGTLGTKANINKAYIYEWMKKKTLPCLDNLFTLAKFFEVSPDYLLGRTDYRN